jgi:hypothetical protein
LKDEWNDDFMAASRTPTASPSWARISTYKPVGMTNVDAEFLDNRKLSRSEVAAIFRVPAHKIGIMDNATFSNIEHQSLEYVTDTLMPIAVRWEGALNAALLRESEQADYYFEFLFDGLLRGDFLSRMQGYHPAPMGPLLQRHRGMENWPRVERRRRRRTPGAAQHVADGPARPDKTRRHHGRPSAGKFAGPRFPKAGAGKVISAFPSERAGCVN